MIDHINALMSPSAPGGYFDEGNILVFGCASSELRMRSDFLQTVEAFEATGKGTLLNPPVLVAIRADPHHTAAFEADNGLMRRPECAASLRSYCGKA